MTLPDVFIRRSKQSETATDDELMRLVRRGDAAAFRLIYDRYKSQVFIYCMRMLNDRDGAKDIVQEVFIRVHAMCRTYRSGTNFNGWVHTIARNLCLNFHRDSGLHEHVRYDESMDYGVGNHDFANDASLSQYLAFEIEQLPVIYRESLILREYEGRTYEDIAAILGVTMATVKFRIFRAREILRERLTDRI